MVFGILIIQTSYASFYGQAHCDLDYNKEPIWHLTSIYPHPSKKAIKMILHPTLSMSDCIVFTVLKYVWMFSFSLGTVNWLDVHVSLWRNDWEIITMYTFQCALVIYSHRDSSSINSFQDWKFQTQLERKFDWSPQHPDHLSRNPSGYKIKQFPYWKSMYLAPGKLGFSNLLYSSPWMRIPESQSL